MKIDIDPQLIPDVIHYLRQQRDLLVRSHAIPGTDIVDDEGARNELARIGVLVHRLNVAMMEGR